MRLSFSLNICSAKPAIEINKKGNSTATSTRYEFTQNLYVLDNIWSVSERHDRYN